MLPREWSVQHRMVALRSVPTYIVSANGPIVSANGPGPLPELPDPHYGLAEHPGAELGAVARTLRCLQHQDLRALSVGGIDHRRPIGVGGLAFRIGRSGRLRAAGHLGLDSPHRD